MYYNIPMERIGQPIRVNKRRTGEIELDPAAVQGLKYREARSIPDNYQVPFEQGRAYQQMKNYQERSQYVRPSPKHLKQGPWWIKGVAHIPDSVIVNDQPATNLLNPQQDELADVDKRSPYQYYGTIATNIGPIEQNINALSTAQAHSIRRKVQPFIRESMRELIYNRRNNLPALKAEQKYDVDSHRQQINSFDTILHTKLGYRPPGPSLSRRRL